MAESRRIDETECVQLLTGGVIGRVGLSTPAGLHVVPVNYSVVDHAIVICTAPSTLLGTYGPGAGVAFEVDYFDFERHLGWSVLARGRAHAITDADEIEHVERARPPRPWAAGPRTLFVKIPWVELAGVRLGDGWTVDNEMPVRRRT